MNFHYALGYVQPEPSSGRVLALSLCAPEAAIENIANAGYRLSSEYNLPDDWAEQVYRWLSDNGHHCENTDDQGYWPSDEELSAAVKAIGFPVSEG